MPPWQFVQAVQGVNGANAAIATAKITKTGGVGGVWDAGTSSVQTIAGDGFVETTVTAVGVHRMVGLSDVDVDVNFNTIDYGAFLTTSNNVDGQLDVYENGVLKFTAGAGSLVVGDVVRVERVGTTVRYYKNGELKYTSATASVVPVRVDTSIFSAAAFIGMVRLYDGTLKSWPALTWQNTTNVTVAADTSATTRRITFTAPLKMRAGDQLVAIFGSQGTEFVSATSSTWDFINSFVSATNKRGCAVYRRIVTDSEPSSYTFDLNVTQETLGALIVYRGLDNAAAWVGGSGVDFAAATVFPCPSRTLTRYSDLYLGVVLTTPVAGSISLPSGWNALGAFFTQSALGVISMRLAIFDIALEAVGATDTQRATDGVAQSGMAASVLLQGLPAPIGVGVTRAIGLQVVGV